MSDRYKSFPNINCKSSDDYYEGASEQIPLCRDLLEKTLALNIENSIVAAEIFYQPSFAVQGRTMYCQLRKRNDEMFICYEHFSMYELILKYNYRNCSVIPSDFLENYCGIVLLDKESQEELEQCITKVNSMELSEKEEIEMVLDGYDHLVIVNSRVYYWWGRPEAAEAVFLDDFVNRVFAHLPADLRRTED